MNFLQVYFSVSHLADGGPIYAETNLQLLIAEPYNAISSLAYLLPAFYWFVRLKDNYKEYPFLISCLPLLVLGGIGSTLYHAFRSSSFLLFLDVFPIVLLTLMVSIYFWVKVLPKWWHVFFILVPFILSRYFIYTWVSEGTINGSKVEVQTVINISYFITGVMIFLPALILMIKEKFRNAFSILISCVLFMLGLFFRETDSWHFTALPMGTHFLWHISTAAGSWFLGDYLYSLRTKEIKLA